MLAFRVSKNDDFTKICDGSIFPFISLFGFVFKSGIIIAMELRKKINIYCCYSCEQFGVTSLNTSSNLGLLLFIMERPNLTSSSMLIHHK